MRVNSKDRKHSGYYTPDSTIPFRELQRQELFINPEYDDWMDYRDGQRDWCNDNTLLKHIPAKYLEMSDTGHWRLKMNQKIQREGKIRKARKASRNAFF